jgi:hypothetical protein
MLNNITNFFNLIKGRRIKTQLEDTDLIAVGTKQSPALGDYKPTAIQFSDLQAQLGGGGGISNLQELNFKKGSIGPKVSFTKTSGSNPNTNKDIIIPGELEITRGNGGGLYNIAQETSYNNVSPINTTWNTQYVDSTNTSWASLWDIENRTYTTWVDAVGTNYYNAPPQYVGTPAIMKWDNGVDEPRYWLIMFTQWGVGAYGEQGSFAYDRYEILESVYVEQIASSNPNTPQVIDVISDGVHITRRYTAVDNNSYQDSIYNIVSEPFAVGGGVSPRNTKWNSVFTDTRPNYSGYTDLSNLESRVYVDFIGALDGDFNNILSTELIMHDMTTDLYHKVQFTDWSEACDLPTGAVVSYNVIQEGIGYPDAGVGANPWLILTAEGGSGSGLEIGLGSISGTTYTSYIQENATGYQVGDILTFPYPGVTDVYTIEITAVADVCISGGFAYTRTVIPQSEGIKFADGTVMNTAVSGTGGSGVQSVTGLNTDNTDPLNPVVEISVDGVTITGDGTSGNPLVSASLPSWLESNATDLTIWNNGQGNVVSNTSYGDGALRSAGGLSLNNTAIGRNALSLVVNASFNTALGASALQNNTLGSGNTAVGSNTLLNNSTGSYNTAIGDEALSFNQTDSCTAVGWRALQLNTTGTSNVAVGRASLLSNTSGFDNTALGEGSLFLNDTGSFNTAVGRGALQLNTSGSNNTANGPRSLQNNTTGSGNTANGVQALFSNTTGSQNVALGFQSLFGNNTGLNNTAIGTSALFNNTTGSENVAIGNGSMSGNVIGFNNTAVGTATSSGNFSNSVILGYGATATGSGQFVVGSSIVNAGVITTETITPDTTWTVRINGATYKIPLLLIP